MFIQNRPAPDNTVYCPDCRHHNGELDAVYSLSRPLPLFGLKAR
jgi:hypothetical protein